jgi:uncharacterized protein (DUF486 family)
MTFAWYGHLKSFKNNSVFFVIVISWAIALLEYIFQVPANRIGFQKAMFTLGQLKILQEAIALLVFIPFSIFYMKQDLSWNFALASLFIFFAVYFMFKT